MSRQSSIAGSNVFSSRGVQIGRLSTSDPIYRSTLWANGIAIDPTGRRLPNELRDFVDQRILQRRTSPQLDDVAVGRVLDAAEELADSTAAPTHKLVSSLMLPFERPGVAQGGDSPWNTAALPRNPNTLYEVAVPQPYLHLGYPINQRSEWSLAQNNVAIHPVARPYAYPARGNAFPFLMVEVQSEAAGGTILVAENQAAGSGSHAVNALTWLLREADGNHAFHLTETVAFTLTLTHRHAAVHIHWYSEEDRRYHMSFLRSYCSFTPADIRACNNTVKNIIDYGLGERKTTIGAALEALFPYPQHWKQARSAAPMTPAESSADGARGVKRRA